MPQRLFGLALFSGALLCIEIGLTRLISTLYYPPFVFVILSLAVLGIGLGAAFAAWQPALRRTNLLPAYTAAAAFSVVVLLLMTTHITGSHGTPILFTTIVLPFLFGGLTLATLFGHYAEQSTRLYLADLAGAGIGALLVVPLLNQLGVINGLLAAALAAALGGMLLERTHTTPWTAGTILFIALLLVGNLRLPLFTVDLTRGPVVKPAAERLRAGGYTVDTVWDAFARTDLIDPGDGRPRELYMDGAAGSVMPPAAGHPALLQDIGFFPFATEQPARVFIVGPGGGLDVWFGLQSNAQEIVAAEVNPASVALVQKYADYNGDLYDAPPVRVIVGEGRSVLERESERFDLIFLSQVVTLAAERSGYALVENSAYTVEAFQTYLDHLSAEGQVALKLYDELTLTRALSTALAALRDRGLSDEQALHHVIALLDPKADPPIPLLLVRNEPYSRDDALSIGAVANDVGFRPLFLPHVWAEPPLDAVASGARSFADVMAASASDISPTTDDRPFFFQFERGIPAALRSLLWGMAGVVMVGALLLIATQSRTAVAGWAGRALYFATLGMGFIMVEIALIQQTQRFLGHPTFAVTLVLVTLLVGGGAGSGLAGYLVRSSARIPRWPLIAVLTGLLAWGLGWSWIRETFFALPQVGRAWVVVASLLPLALCMGMPFPLGLRTVGKLGAQEVARAWAINGAMSVVGSVAAIALALVLGYRAVYSAAGATYLLALGSAWWAARRD